MGIPKRKYVDPVEVAPVEAKKAVDEITPPEDDFAGDDEVPF